MPHHSNSQRKCSVPGWTRGEHREIRPYEQHALFKPLGSFRKGITGEVEVVRLVAPPCDSAVCKRICLDSWQAGKKKGIVEEVKRLKSLDHQHIIDVIGTYQAANEYAILMCPVGDQNLEAFLAQLDSQRDEQYQKYKTWLHGWFSCIASALFYVHRKGLVHKNIAPKNIVHRGSKVFFTDFGLTISTASSASAITAYSAPEIEQTKLQHTRCSDIFSLGCVYLEMLIAINSRSLKDFRASCQESLGCREAIHFRYYSALCEIKKLFDDQYLCDSWGRAILPMLDPDEKTRPRADEVLQRLQAEDLLPPASERFCSCQPGGATSSSGSLNCTSVRQSSQRLPTHLAGLGAVPDQILFFTVRNNTAANFQIDLVQPARCQPWHALEVVPLFKHKSYNFQVGDLVWIRLAGEPDAIAEIAEARAIGDGNSRIFIRVFWYYLRKDVLHKMNRPCQKIFPARYEYVKSTHIQILLCDTIQMKITETERRLILPQKVLDGSWNPYRIYHTNAPKVSWSNVDPSFSL